MKTFTGLALKQLIKLQIGRDDMYLKTLKPTYSGLDTIEKISILISYVEELGDEIAYRLETLTQAVENIKKDIYGEGANINENS